MSARTHEIVVGLIKSVKAMNEAEFSDQLDVLFELYPTRTVLLDYISAMMCEIGSQWEKGELMVMMEHFASNIVISKLKAMLNEQSGSTKGPTIIVACAEHEQHEIGALIIGLLLSINGWKVVYLGQNTPTSDLIYAIDKMDVHTLCLSCSHERNLEFLIRIGRHLQQTKKSLHYIVGGLLFSLNKDIINKIPCAVTKNFNDLISLRPETHPGMQDLLVRQSVDKTYTLLREAAQRLKSSSNALARKRTTYLFDQVAPKEQPAETTV